MPRRGEVWLVDFCLAQKTRPAVILNVPYGDTDRVVVTIVSHTNTLRGLPFKITAPVPFLREGAFAVQSVTTIPSRHALRRLGTLALAQLAPIEAGVRAWLGL